MKSRFILYRRKLGGVFYLEDTQTSKQESLGTKNRAEATALLNARNESVRQPQLNRQIAHLDSCRRCISLKFSPSPQPSPRPTGRGSQSKLMPAKF